LTLIASASTTVDSAAGVLAAVGHAVAHPSELSRSRRALTAELFHEPGTATDRAVNELYDLIELDLPARVQPTVAVQANVYG
jgi:hypothetical protein